MTDTILVLSDDITDQHVTETGIHARVVRKHFDDVFPTKSWLAGKYTLGRNPSGEEVRNAASQHVAQWTDVVAVILDQGKWNLYTVRDASCQFAIKALRRHSPGHEVWVVRDNGQVVRAQF